MRRMKTIILTMAILGLVGCGEEPEGGPATVAASISCNGGNAKDARLIGPTWTASDGATWKFSEGAINISLAGNPSRIAGWCTERDTVKVFGFDDSTVHEWTYAVSGDVLTLAETYRLMAR